MRIRPTTTWVTREATADFIFDGLVIRAGTTLHLFCESAGTDPGDAGGTESGDAGSGDAVAGFDITAGERRPHFGFGGGIHYCLGHYVARTDMCEALTVLARRLREPRPAGAGGLAPRQREHRTGAAPDRLRAGTVTGRLQPASQTRSRQAASQTRVVMLERMARAARQ